MIGQHTYAERPTHRLGHIGLSQHNLTVGSGKVVIAVPPINGLRVA
jgi:hypothetical protein